MNIPEDILSRLTDEQKKKARNAKTPEEFLAIAKETGFVLTEEQLNAMAGGWCITECSEDDCPSYWDPDP